MPTYTYEFQDTGERIDIVQRMSEPALTEIDGRAVARVPVVAQFSTPSAGRWNNYPYVSNRLPSTIKGCKMVKQGGRYKPLIESERHEKKVMAMNDLTKDAASNEVD